MAKKTAFRLAVVLALGITSLLISAAPASANDKVIHRSIQELVRAQGTYCFADSSGACTLFAPPVANYIFFQATATQWIAAVDYAGLENAWLKNASFGRQSYRTRFSGTVDERPLRDGRADIKIRLRIERAAARVFLPDGTLLFGNASPSVLTGAKPAIGESSLDFEFINPRVGMPLPDLLQVGFANITGQDFVILHMRSEATGPLHAAFGVPEGTRGRMVVDMISTAANPSAREVLQLSTLPDD